MTQEESNKIWYLERIERLEKMQEKNQILSGEILESIMRLERIVIHNTGGLMDLEERIKELENRKSRIS